MKGLALLLSVGILVFAGLGGCALFELPAEHEDAVSIFRDEYGVPHVYGTNPTSLFYGVGYAHAEDRLWQAELFRRLAAGTLAEWYGTEALAGDLFARQYFGPRERRLQLLQSASDEIRHILQPYAAGINVWIAEAKATGKLPIEYERHGVQPRPWTVDDSLAILMFFGETFGSFGGKELENAAFYLDLVTRLGTETADKVFADTHWLDDSSATTSVPAEAQAASLATPLIKQGALPNNIIKAAKHLQLMEKAQARVQARAGIIKAPASNAFVIVTGLSADRAPLLVGGPQMAYTTPQTNLETGIHGAGFDVTGIGFAGVPLITVGVGKGYAWTLTSGGTDNMDIFAEALNPDNHKQYRFKEAWRELDSRTEKINVRDQKPVLQEFGNSVHGPVITMEDGMAYALQQAVRGLEISSAEAWLDLGKAKSFRNFEESLSRIAYNFNVLYANTQGDIGYWHIGGCRYAAGDKPLVSTARRWRGRVAGIHTLLRRCPAPSIPGKAGLPTGTTNPPLVGRMPLRDFTAGDRGASG